MSTTKGEFVLRGNPQSPQQFPKERVVAAAANARSSLPVPWQYHVSNDIDPFGWAFAIMPVLPGTMGSSIWAAVDDEIKLDLAAAHGAALAQLHQTTCRRDTMSRCQMSTTSRRGMCAPADASARP